MERRVARDQIDDHLKALKRLGVERLVSCVPDGDEFIVVTETRTDAPQETRG